MVSFYVTKIVYLIFGIIFAFLSGLGARDWIGTYKTAKGDWLDFAFCIICGMVAIGCFWMV